MSYKENPKTKGSGIVCAIPQTGPCPVGCSDCFFQSGRSYLEPLAENLPNVPDNTKTWSSVLRVNDGNDSNVDRKTVENKTSYWTLRFFNTSIPKDLGKFPGPVVLTVNPGSKTDRDIYVYPHDDPPPNLMFVRFRTNTWNLGLLHIAVGFWADIAKIPVVLTFMAYHDVTSIPDAFRKDYVKRKRTLNEYWAVTEDAYDRVTLPYRRNLLVYSCGRWEGRSNGGCVRCGNCLREFFAARERTKPC